MNRGELPSRGIKLPSARQHARAAILIFDRTVLCRSYIRPNATQSSRQECQPYRPDWEESGLSYALGRIVSVDAWQPGGRHRLSDACAVSHRLTGSPVDAGWVAFAATLAADLETRIVRLLDENQVSTPARRELEALRYGIAIARRN